MQTDMISTIVYLSMRKDLLSTELALTEVPMITQSLMCALGRTGWSAWTPRTLRPRESTRCSGSNSPTSSLWRISSPRTCHECSADFVFDVGLKNRFEFYRLFMTLWVFIVAGVINFVSVCHAMMYLEILSIAEHGSVFRKRHVNRYDAVAVSGCFS